MAAPVAASGQMGRNLQGRDQSPSDRLEDQYFARQFPTRRNHPPNSRQSAAPEAVASKYSLNPE